MTQENLLAENAELKRKLAEAEQWRKTHEVCHDKWDGLQSRLAEAEKSAGGLKAMLNDALRRNEEYVAEWQAKLAEAENACPEEKQ
jgi:hypothetical protein